MKRIDMDNKHHGKKLKEFVKTNLEISIVEFGKRYLPHKSRAAVFALFRKEQFSLSEICLFCQYFPYFSPSDFDQPKDIFVTPFNKNVNSQSMTTSVSLNAFARDKHGFWGFISEYYAHIINCLQEAKKYAMVYLYLGKVKGVPFPGMIEKVREYYHAMEKKVLEEEANGFSYTLVLALPQQSPMMRPQTFEATVREIIRQMFFETFAHVARCFYEFERAFYLYALPSPSRLYSYHLLDEKYVISEYDRLNKDGAASNNLLFVNRIKPDVADDPIKFLHADYLMEINSIKNEASTFHQTKITRNGFLLAVDEIHQEMNERIADLEKQHQEESYHFSQLKPSFGPDDDLLGEEREERTKLLEKLNRTTDAIRAKKRERKAIKKKMKYLDGLQSKARQ